MTADLLLDIDVIGTPRPKGSMRHVGRGILVENRAHSGDWRHTVVTTVHAEIVDGDGGLRDGYPELGPVTVGVTLRFARPKSRKTGEPASRSTGDVDKHARNLLDALQDSGLFKDDAQVVNLSIAKRYCGPSEVPGAHIVVCGAA